jgi:[acyl-carrier-protein] S-malonyltransferase
MTFAILCPGQGAQHERMFDVALAHPRGAAVIDAVEATLGFNARAHLASGDRMFDNVIAQPLICTAQLATWAALRDDLPAPGAIAGYSLGELACYAVAGAIQASSLVGIAKARADLMDGASARPGNLIAQRGLRRSTIEAMCRGRDAWVAIAIDDDASVVGGTSSAIDALQDDMEGAGAQITCLRVGVASHTPLLASAVDPFRKVLAESTLRAPVVPVMAGIDAAPVTTRDRAIETLAAQLARTIEWAQCLDALFERGCRVFLELGPGRALSRMAVDRLHDIQARSIEEFGDPSTIAGWVRRGLR